MARPFSPDLPRGECSLQDASQEAEIEGHDGTSHNKAEEVPEVPHDEDNGNRTEDKDSKVQPFDVI